jgi:hypothetical protein
LCAELGFVSSCVEVDKLAVVVVEDDDAEPVTVPEPVVLPPLEAVEPVLEADAVDVSEEVEGAAAFGVFAACACSRAPPQATAAHTIPIAIFRLTRFEAL